MVAESGVGVTVSKGESSGVSSEGVVRCRENQAPPGPLPPDFERV